MQENKYVPETYLFSIQIDVFKIVINNFDIDIIYDIMCLFQDI